MDTQILDGRRVAEAMKVEVAQEIARLREQGQVPGLAVVLVGENPASRIYVRNKTRTCAELGMHSEQVDLPAEASTEELLGVVEGLNRRPEIDAILVQLPLPSHIEEAKVLSAVRPEKDVDGFHPVNVGKLCSGRPGLVPCTPLGILELLRREGIPLKGAEAVVVGRSNIVGKPVALLLLQEHATVTICHSRTRHLEGVCRRAELLVAAVGRPGLIDRQYLREGAIVIDVGINRIDRREDAVRFFGEGSERLAEFDRRGHSLVGDVHPQAPWGRASAVTPVPGGVGPLTIAQLMKNTLRAFHARRGAEASFSRK